MDIHTIDLMHLGHPQRIAAYLVVGPYAPVLVETGPFSCHRALVEGLATHGLTPADLRNVFLTHIHLDHAGAAGWWAQQGATVYVHEKGASHLADPERLIASATRLYRERMDELWGEIRPAPRDRLRIVADGETVTVGGLEIEALDTPGHASHHHVYRIDDIAFTGDLAAVVVPGTGLVEPPTPPPEYDLELWHASLDRVAGFDLRAIYPTHFGRVDEVESHLELVVRLLAEATGLVRRKLEEGLNRQEIDAAFGSWNRERLVAAGATDEQLRDIATIISPQLSLAGILRYWQKRQGLVASKAP
jgi:glyoxylase-like metal-dependent hydrolase (beta-lactamase superfamily II)